MSYPGATFTKFGRYAVAEPFRPERMHVYRGAALKTADWEPPVPVLDQEDLLAQNIDTSALVQGAAKVDALGSCTANATTVSLGQHYKAVRGSLPPGITGDPVADEEYAIKFYAACTQQTGDPSQEWPPTDCGSTGLYCCNELEKQKLISSFQSGSSIHDVASLLQTGTVIVGGPWFNSWMEPDSNGFVDGDGSVDSLMEAIASGVAGGHERCISAIENIEFNLLGMIDAEKSVVRERNSWSSSWADNGSHRLHLSTYQLLGHYQDYKAFVVAAA